MSRHIAVAVAASLPMLGTAVAQEAAVGQQHAVAQEEDWRTWGDMREQVVGVEELLEADISNGINPVAGVTDLVLSADGNRIEYVMMEVPFPYAVYGGEDGFVAYDRVDIQRGGNLDVDLVIDRDEPVSPPEELRLSGTEANNRLVSRLLSARMYFPGEGDASREITDILVDRETGMVTHWVVEMIDDALFSTDRRAIPAEQVSVEEGSPSAQIQLATVDELQEYDPEFL